MRHFWDMIIVQPTGSGCEIQLFKQANGLLPHMLVQICGYQSHLIFSLILTIFLFLSVMILCK